MLAVLRSYVYRVDCFSLGARSSAVIEYVRANLNEAHSALENLMANEQALDAVAKAASLMVASFQGGGKVMSCGNGGSMCDALHFAEELTGRFRKDRPALPALSVGDSAHISCAANDFGYDAVFSRYVEAHGNKGDCLLGISTSGRSKNVIEAARVAKSRGLKVIALVGRHDSELGALADLEIATPGGRFADRVQELHIKVIHIMIELIERELFNESYS